MGRGAVQDRASCRRGILVAPRLGVRAPGVGRLLHAGRRRRCSPTDSAGLLADRLMSLFSATASQRLDLVRRSARLRQCAASPGADPDRTDDPHAKRTSRSASDRCAGSTRFRPRHRDTSGRSGRRASAGTVRSRKRSISSRSRRQRRFPPALPRGERRAARSGRWRRSAHSSGFWAKTTCRRR